MAATPPKTGGPAAPQNPTPTPAPVSGGDKTVSGHMVQIMGFIPDTQDKRAHGNLVLALADIEDGKADISSLAPKLRMTKVKVSHIRKRFTAAEAASLMGPSPQTELKLGGEPETKGDTA